VTKPSMPSNFVVIVNYRTANLVVACLASLVAELPALGRGRVIVVDNASGDRSVEVLQAAVDKNQWNAWVEVIALPKNGGFAFGNNRAIERVRQIDPHFDVAICLNPDTVVQPGALNVLLSHFDHDAKVGIVGASIEDEHGTRQQSAHPFPSLKGELNRAAQLQVLSNLIGAHQDFSAAGSTPTGAPTSAPTKHDWVSGACFAIRRELLDTIGPLDEGYFLYFEETDFCLRAKQAGWSCWQVPQARVMHFEGAATGITAAKRRLPEYWFASRRRFFVKAYGMGGWIAADVLWTLGRLSLVARRALRLGGRQSEGTEPHRVLRDLLGSDLRALVKADMRHVFRKH
jgi:N-acetylglucosaminyl-diphospho-decaprenol L-rhamnosyltransferase